MFQTYNDFKKYLEMESVDAVNLKVSDLHGMMRQLTVPAKHIDERLFAEGMGIGMSSYPGYRTIEASDMKIIPDLATAFLEPLKNNTKVLNLVCNIFDPEGNRFSRDPRYIMEQAENYAKQVLEAEEILCNAELEFYIFDDVRFASTVNSCYYQVDSVEGIWNTGRIEDKNLANKIPRSGGQHAASPRDHQFEIRNEIVKVLESCGVSVKYHHHELGGAGQAEIELPFEPIYQAADHVQIAKYLIKNVAKQFGKTVTFMPKPLFDEAGNGMHLHIFPMREDKSLFYDAKGYAGLSDQALQFTGGILQHTPALMAITNPSTNSYRRFTRGLAAPVNLFFSLANRSAAIRIPGYSIGPREQRIEYRMPDAISNPYLCMAAVMMAGVEGVEKAISPQENGFGPYDVNVYALPEEERAKMKSVPTSLEEALHSLEQDQSFLTNGGVFDKDLIQEWVTIKQKEINEVHARTHPYEFFLYYDR